MTIRLISSNLDSTLLGSPGAAHHFRLTWESIPKQRRPVLVYNSGRLLHDIQRSIENNHLPEPDYLIGGVGTQIYDNRKGEMVEAYQADLRENWDLELIDRIAQQVPGIERQPDNFQGPLKSSWWLHNATAETIQLLREQLVTNGLDATVVYSSSRDLDILPDKASKGLALKWLAEHLGIELTETLVVGSSANDASCYFLPGVKGIVVENAKPELFEAVVGLEVYRAHRVMSEGLADGLVHFGVIEQAPSLSMPHAGPEADQQLQMLFDPDLLDGVTDEQKLLLSTGYEKALDALRRNITPLGYSAASLEDNETTGTDENYNSVWGRDGAITVISTLDIEDAEVQACNRRTLETLFESISPAGQLPANVRIASRRPDYSGVGGICAIDSNLWLLIAMYQYAVRSGDHDLLHRFRGEMQRAMDWISAHDSNNDGLLEVPEASDWTDLFGRSYNVLYDEILWYRANLCYARILELEGEHGQAADYHHWAQFIQGKILRTFWPSSGWTGPTAAGATTPSKEVAATFADRQYTLGDTHYLLAEVTPFSFSWRCDVYANVIAFLMGVIDADKARKAFAFMWGCGVNDPYPVANLYPVVQAGDPDWRSYYTVNLLNLPDHYHNGGIWPLCGGMWVRFIHRLGQHGVAVQELVKLAELCRLGAREPWEFNEWAHGKTGRPMGKRYQAWSAASFLRACHELQVFETDNLETA